MISQKRIEKTIECALIMANGTTEDTRKALLERLYKSRNFVNSQLNQASDYEEKILMLKNALNKLEL